LQVLHVVVSVHTAQLLMQIANEI